MQIILRTFVYVASQNSVIVDCLIHKGGLCITHLGKKG